MRRIFSALSCRVHPRSRGAARSKCPRGLKYQGPSPLARGSLMTPHPTVRMKGSIPARAGQPSVSLTGGRAFRVHPRSRGAADINNGSSQGLRGPSPLARGSRVAPHRPSGAEGSIPARAGQPAATEVVALNNWVHPRSRGAARRLQCLSWAWQGPSPLARGSRVSTEQPKLPEGSIPARAGQPMAAAITQSTAWVHPRSRGAAAT